MTRSAAFILLFILATGAFIGWGCANIVPPSGGPRDSLPPVLVNARPGDSAVNFRGNRITLEFNEYIDLQEVAQNVVVSPTPEANPLIDVRLRTITVRLRDSLEPNTTYNIYFGNAIRDINESNVLPNFDYTFSTGPALDSLTLSGTVVLAETGKIDTTLLAVLYRNSTDSAVIKEKPRYIAKLDGKGRFTFRNLPAGTFHLYAFGNEGGSRRYNERQFFAFLDSPIVVGPTTAAPTLYAYKTITATAPVATATPRAAATNNTNDKRLRFTTTLSNNVQDIQKPLIVTFERPLRNLDTTKISLRSDSTFTPAPYSAVLDSLRRTLTLTSPWKDATPYFLIVDKDFAEDSLGRKLLKTDTLNFTTNKKADYGTVNIRLRNIDSTRNPILQFVQNGAVLLSASVRRGTFSQALFAPGEYELRILYDRNNNGKWDPGQFFRTRRQPELVQPLERRITVKPAWDNDFDIAL